MSHAVGSKTHVTEKFYTKNSKGTLFATIVSLDRLFTCQSVLRNSGNQASI